MADILSKICKDKLDFIVASKIARSEGALLAEVKMASPPRGFQQMLEQRVLSHSTALIAELKKASPSKGLIRELFSPTLLAKDYESGGAACLSVLTDEPYFQGNIEYLAMARNAVSLPVLRKDFILDSYQVIESRAMGADCILLIMAILSDAQAKELSECAREMQMDVLVEIHDEEELDRVMEMRPSLLGINNRNLKTLEVNLSVTERLAPLVSSDWSIVCESGIYSSGDIKKIKLSGVHQFLVGESLMRQEDVVRATQTLLSVPS